MLSEARFCDLCLPRNIRGCYFIVKAVQLPIMSAKPHVPSKADSILVIGAGIFGLSTAIHLAERGYANVTLLDKQPYEKTLYSYANGCDAASAGQFLFLPYVVTSSDSQLQSRYQQDHPIGVWLAENLSDAQPGGNRCLEHMDPGAPKRRRSSTSRHDLTG